MTQAALSPKPTSAVLLSLVGGTITLTVESIGVTSVALGFLGFGGLIPLAREAIVVLFIIGLASSLVIFYGAVMMNSSDRSRVRKGSLLVLAFTAAAAPFSLYGLFVGGLLCTIGGLKGLFWKPPTMPVKGATPARPDARRP